jgi:type III restriction enzyme
VPIICPNLAIEERLRHGKFRITNWHLFLPRDDSRSKNIVRRGVESNAAFCQRVPKELGNKQSLLVINDEAHHAYRLARLHLVAFAIWMGDTF